MAVAAAVVSTLALIRPAFAPADWIWTLGVQELGAVQAPTSPSNHLVSSVFRSSRPPTYVFVPI